MRINSAGIWCLLLFLLSMVHRASADDVGITKARLIQINDSTYVFEADISRNLISAIGAPGFPDEFQVSEPTYSNGTNWVIVTYRINGSETLQDTDKIHLLWGRTGVDLTVQWQDGEIFQGLFLNRGQGIYIPISEIRESEVSLLEVLRVQSKEVLDHFLDRLLHLLLPIVLVLGWRKEVFSLQNLAMAFAGVGTGLLFYELGIGEVSILFAQMVEVIAVMIMAYFVLNRQAISQLSWLIFLVIGVHTLGWANELAKSIGDNEQLLWLVLYFEIMLRLIQVILGLILFVLISRIKTDRFRNLGLYSCGVLAVAILCWSFTLGIEAEHRNQKQLNPEILLASNGLAPPQNSIGALELSSPMMAYYAVEPHEVRAEILINARAAVRKLGIDDQGKAAIPVESQQSIKDYLLEGFEANIPLKIEGKPAQPIASSINFVELTPAGVLLRESPQPESLEEGILGITLIYESEGLADELELQWNVFIEDFDEVEVSITDLFGLTTTILTTDNPTLTWKSRLPGYQVPQIDKIEVLIPKYSLLSLILALGAILVLSIKKTISSSRYRQLAFTALVLAGLFYPMLRTAIRLPFVELVTEDTTETEHLLEDLLSNVYRAFDVRDEGAVYDRLAISVSGEQLNRIYLENRKSMELEERGGARANVDEVEVNEVSNIQEDNGQYTADVAWNVGGSVSHFGHTHYRQNSYVAKVSFQIVEDSWKITDIELLDEERIL